MSKTGEKKNNRKKILKRRYRAFLSLGNFLLSPIIKFRYRAKIERFKSEKKQNYLILSNHQTPFDQFFISKAIKGDLFFVASEDILSNGAISRFINYALGLIPIKKQTTDPRAAINCLRVAKAGGSIVLFPEGNRTYSGETCFIKPSVVSLAKMLKLPIVFFKIKGGYGVQPRWSDDFRKGKVDCKVERVMPYEEYADLTDEELYDIIKSELYQNDNELGQTFISQKSAENLERLLYVCPDCGFTTFLSNGNEVTCTRCKKTARYLPDLTFEGDFPFKTVLEWYRFQEKFVASSDLLSRTGEPIFSDDVRLFEVKLYERKRLLSKRATVKLFGDGFTIDLNGKTESFPFDKVFIITVLGRHKINFSSGGRIYQMKGDKSFNAIKYVNFFNVYKQIKEGKQDDFFFGL